MGRVPYQATPRAMPGVVALQVVDMLSRFLFRWLRPAPAPVVYERLCVDVETGERMIAQGEGWQYGGYFIADSMWVYRQVV